MDVPTEATVNEAKIPREPVGRAMTPLDGIIWFTEEPGKYYTVWNGGDCIGDVTTLSRPITTAGIYGGSVHAPKPEYEGRVETTGQTFKVHDIYQAVREIMRRWRLISSESPHVSN